MSAHQGSSATYDEIKEFLENKYNRQGYQISFLFVTIIYKHDNIFSFEIPNIFLFKRRVNNFDVVSPVIFFRVQPKIYDRFKRYERMHVIQVVI